MVFFLTETICRDWREAINERSAETVLPARAAGRYRKYQDAGIWYLCSATLSYCCGIVVNYLANKYIMFHDPGPRTAAQFATFTAISVSCLGVNPGVVWLAVTFLSFTPLAAKIVATCCAFLWSNHG